MAKQVKIYDIDNDMYHGGILLDNGDVICACCGGLLEADEKDVTYKIDKIYDYWVDFTDEICGE